MDFWKEISSRLKESKPGHSDKLMRLRINNHVHTPWSFSSFASIDELIKQAKKESIGVLGVNDFNTIAGYKEFSEKCLANNIFPLFNIEMIGLDHSGMKEGLRVNDPGNPGRTYISGKGLSYPSSLSDKSGKMLAYIVEMSNKHVELMTEKANKLLFNINNSLKVDYANMLSHRTNGMVRERHLAGMIREVIIESALSDLERNEVFEKLLDLEYSEIDRRDKAALENIIRSKLLKAGGEAYVEEDPKIFIDPSEIKDIILDAGGIPTYPFLADFKSGEYTDFELDKEKAASTLIENGFYSVEFIPARNNYIKFKEYAEFLHGHGFIVSFGTEHNAPGNAPLEVFGGGGVRLDTELMDMNIEAASIIAAHQYMSFQEGEGYLNGSGIPKIEEKEEYIQLGKKLIESVIS